MKASILIPCLLLSAVAHSADNRPRGLTEIRDPLRGATFYSAEISNDALVDLQLGFGRFLEGDTMTTGISAFLFDESTVVDDYVLWLRHDGPRRWFTGENSRPVRIIVDGRANEPTPLHTLRASAASDTGPFVEKIELTMKPSEFRALIDAEAAAIEVTTLFGTVRKELDNDDVAALRRFDERVRERREQSGTSTIN